MKKFLLAATVALSAPLAVSGVAQAQTLNIGVGGAITSVDPHFYNAAPNNSLAAHIFSKLVERDANAQPVPGLATSWKAVEPTVWEFKLMPGVTWHDGKPFTAEDVAFTIARVPNVPNSPGGYGGFVRAIKRVEIVDPLTVRFHTEEPAPLLPTELGSVAIISKHVGEGATTEDYNSGKAAIGTGPYRLTAYRSGDRTELARFDAYKVGPMEPWEKVNYRFIGNDGARTAALLSGDVDMIDQVPTSDAEKLEKDARVHLYKILGLRVIYLISDFSRQESTPFITDAAGKPISPNPLLDLRVRKALSMAIDREAITTRVMEGAAQPTGQWLPPGAFGYNPDVKPTAYDPNGAKRLLAEAGFPNGFKLVLHGPNDRYPNDARTIQAVAQMFTRVGIQTQVEALPWASYSVRNARQEFSLRLGGWGSGTGEASYALVNILGTFDRAKRTGSSNNGRYSNPALDALTAKASATLDDAERNKLQQQAVKMATDDLGIIPLHQLVNVWATRKGFTYEPRADERTWAQGVRRE